MPYGLILDVAVILVIIAAFMRTESAKLRIALGLVLVVIIGLPVLGGMKPLGALWWFYNLFKVLSGVGCAIYLKWPD